VATAYHLQIEHHDRRSRLLFRISYPSSENKLPFSRIIPQIGVVKLKILQAGREEAKFE
jgi:hypothetical protein